MTSTYSPSSVNSTFGIDSREGTELAVDEANAAGGIKGKKVRKVEKAPEPPAAPHLTAAEALDRIEIPDAALARISALMSTGASLIISDKGLGEETGSETDFIVVTSK